MNEMNHTRNTFKHLDSSEDVEGPSEVIPSQKPREEQAIFQRFFIAPNQFQIKKSVLEDLALGVLKVKIEVDLEEQKLKQQALEQMLDNVIVEQRILGKRQ